MGTALYHVRATIFDPIKNADFPLPPHVWLLVRDSAGSDPPRAISRSTPSNQPAPSTGPPTLAASGVCALGTLGVPLPPGDYSLLFLPLDPAIRAGYVKDKEAWIDLDKNDWGPAPTPSSALERRRLLRVPAWSTVRKAITGGFKVTPTGATQFGQRGVIADSEIKPFGTPGAPWDMPLDFNWVKARVKFFFLNWQANKEELLPPGLIVEAIRELKQAGVEIAAPSRAGAGTPVSPTDGTFYMLLEGDRDLWKSIQIRLATPNQGSTFVDLKAAAASPDTRLSNAAAAPPNPDDRNRLPRVWHSRAMRARFGTGSNPAPPATAKTWDRLRVEIANNGASRETMLFFHLDDVALCDSADVALKIPGQPESPTLFDHFLTIIKPGPNKPYQTALKRVGAIIPADAAYSVPNAPPAGKKVLEVSTRLIHFEGKFHDLRDDRVAGAGGKVDCVGARSARADQHLSLKISGDDLMRFFGGRELHVIDVPGVQDPQTKKQLEHLLIYVSCKIKPDSDFPAANIPVARRALKDAGERWSPGHPGIDPTLKTKRYAILSRDPAQSLQRIMRIRTFFGEVSNNQLLNINLEFDPKGQDRSNTSPALFIFKNQSINYANSAVQNDGGAPTFVADKGDLASAGRHTLAHEFGHVLGIPDEYGEIIDPREEVDASVPFVLPVLPSFSSPDEGFSDWRPFYTDDVAIMNSNQLPRLRHFWHQLQKLNNDAAFAKLSHRPFDLIHETFDGTGLSYKVPPNDDKPPWEARFKDVAIPGGNGQCALFPLGNDEGSNETMTRLAAGLAGAKPPMNAILIVRSKLRFVVDSTLNPVARFQVLLDFHEKIYDKVDNSLKIRFVLQGSPTSDFPRIMVQFQPLYAFGSTINPLAAADLRFDIQQTSARPRPNPFLNDSPGTSLLLLLSDFVFEPALRLILGAKTVVVAGGKRTVNLGFINPSDIQGLARLVEQQLGEAAGSRSVGVF